MTLLGAISIPWSGWVWPAGVLVLVVLALLVWSYRHAPGLGAAHTIAFCLKLLGVLILALCLIEPLWSGRRAKSGANLFVVAADNSDSMNIRDRGSDQSRGDALRAILPADGGGTWVAALAENFQLRQYTFDSRLRRTTDFSELTFDGKVSSIGTVLHTIAERYRNRPLAGVLLMTDGIATDMGEQTYDVSGLPPVYPVVVGRSAPQRDIALSNVSVSQTAFEDAPVTIQADAQATGFAARNVAIELTTEAGAVVERQQWSIRRNEDKQVFRFRLRPEETGVLFYRLRIAEVTDEKSEQSEEATLANNERTVVVDRGEGPYRILYVGGRPDWEFAFLKRAISDDEQVDLVGLIRVALREPKYDWRGHAGESSNPLYRGFDPEDAEQTEQYDQPVLVRLGTRDEKELLEGFPKTPEDLFEYHAIILDDTEASFFTHDQMDLVRRFVVDRGGGFLMLGGQASFQRGGFDRTPIGGILPVYLDRVPEVSSTAPIRLNLTREGWLEPWARLRDNEQDERQRLSDMPDFRVLNRIDSVKPGARVVATVGDQADPLPALVVQRLGNGRSAALTVGDVWRWGLRELEMRKDMDKFWRQTLRWLVADVPERMSIQVAHDSDGAEQAVVLRVRTRDEGFEPLDNVSVAIEVRPPGGETVRLPATPATSESGLFEATYLPRTSGGYFAQAEIVDPDGSKVGDAETGWTVDLEAREFGSIQTNRALLESLARQTRGRLVELSELDDFARSLPSQEVPITTVSIRSLWDLPGVMPAVFLFALACFIAEWAIRRWKGMP
ncbi:MAG: hypothetical protein JW993_21000 [Sedimentisphaerales bacterium]|nr:hypothetical protein [Sedimentisphaerales bacterium]